jgi:hypothetical protein
MFDDKVVEVFVDEVTEGDELQEHPFRNDACQAL